MSRSAQSCRVVTKKAALLLVTGLLGYLAAAGVPTTGAAESAAPAASSWFGMRGKVTRVVDGDTLHVRVGKKTERVRLIGIDAPEVGGCFAANATSALRRMVLNKTVRLAGDRTQTRRDVYRRLLAYVTLPSGLDAGRSLLAGGFATVYETEQPFARQRAYETAAAAAARANAGMYPVCATVVQPPTTTATTATTPVPIAPPISTTTNATPPSNCAASYPDVCIPPPPPDLDCGQISHRGFRVVYNVPSPDPHRFDGDRDGIGCES
jgi:micrococcal nuclease